MNIKPLSRGHIWTLAAIGCYIKWVKAIALKCTGETVLANIIGDKVNYCFGIPKSPFSDNVTPFINMNGRRLLADYSINHVKSSPYYLQEKVKQKSLISSSFVFSKGCSTRNLKHGMIFPRLMSVSYLEAHIKTQTTPFFLAYGVDGIVIIELMVPSA